MPTTLKSAEFRREREEAWRQLERLVSRAESTGTSRLTAEELGLLPVLYRATVSSLSVARAISLDANLLAYLEALSARAYLVVYGVRRSVREVVVRFFRTDFPDAVRSLSAAFAVAVGVTLLGAVVGAWLVAGDPETFYALVPAPLAGDRGPSSSAEDLRSVLYAEGERGAHVVFASQLFGHNAQIGLWAFGLGLLGGLPTLLLLLLNGLVLGAMAELHHGRGLVLDFWAWVLPHGVPELFAVLACGAAGLSLARAVVLPGELSRQDALVEAGRKAGTVVVGAVLLLLAAGLIEGVFRQRVHSIAARLTLAGIGAALLTLWIAAPWNARSKGSP